jgi:hypothetical protein
VMGASVQALVSFHPHAAGRVRVRASPEIGCSVVKVREPRRG